MSARLLRDAQQILGGRSDEAAVQKLEAPAPPKDAFFCERRRRGSSTDARLPAFEETSQV